MALTLRLEEDEQRELELLKEYLGMKASSKIISHIILNFRTIKNRLLETEFELDATKEKFDFLCTLIKKRECLERDISSYVNRGGVK